MLFVGCFPETRSVGLVLSVIGVARTMKTHLKTECMSQSLQVLHCLVFVRELLPRLCLSKVVMVAVPTVLGIASIRVYTVSEAPVDGLVAREKVRLSFNVSPSGALSSLAAN